MLSNILIALVIAWAILIYLCVKHIRILRRDVDTLFRLRSEELPAELDTTHESADAEDRIRRVIDEHVDRHHRR